jgi:hypothetical protein
MLTNVQLTVWSRIFNSALRAELNAITALTRSDIVNATIEKGKTVKVQRLADISTIDYDPTGNTFADLADTEIEIAFDQDKITPFKVQNTDEFFSNKSLMMEAAKNMAFSLRDGIDKYIYTQYPTEASIVIDDGLSGYLLVDKDNILDFLGQILTAMNVANIPMGMRTVTIPSWMDPLIRNLEIANKDSAGMGQGFVADVYGIKFYMSNNIVETTGNYDMVGGYDGAFQFAIAYSKLWAGDLGILGIDGNGAWEHAVYGGKAVKAEAMIHMKVKAA